MDVCRICFKESRDMQHLSPFLPLIRILGSTKFPNEETSQICNCCANGLILSNLFRVKVIESNAKYRKMIESRIIPTTVQRRSLERQTATKFEMKVSDDDDDADHKEEYLHNSPSSNTEDDEPNEQTKKTPQKLKCESVAEIKENLKLKIMANIKQLDQICFVCTGKSQKSNNASIFKDTLNRIALIGDIKRGDRLCDRCMKGLKLSKNFFANHDISIKQKYSNNCCQFCSTKSNNMITTSKGSFEIFNSLPKNGHDSRSQYNGKTCMTCVQSLSRIKVLRDTYISKGKYFVKKPKTATHLDKKQKLIAMIEQGETEQLKEQWNELCENDTKQTSDNKSDLNLGDDPKKALISRILADMSDDLANPCDNVQVAKQNSTARFSKKRIRIRAKLRYVCPDIEQSIPEDYQCHMSDFDELDSDTEVSVAHFRAPLNFPFKHVYLKCPECTSKFINSYELEAHIDCMHHTYTNTCNICNKKFRDISFNKAHKLRVHYVNFSTFDYKNLCDICGILTKRFDDHMVQHLGTRPFVCELCSYAGKTKHGLKSHISAIHLGERKYKCKYCDKGFNYTADRGRHEIAMHTKQFKYVCQFCGKCCLKKNFLTAHLRSQHPDKFYEEC